CPKIAPKGELKKLYKKRWQIEVDFRDIKTTMGMEPLSCQSPEMIEKEIWVYFLSYNLIRLLMLQAALLVDILPRQISFKHSLQLWLIWSQADMTTGHERDVNILLHLMGQRIVGNRPGRVEPRALKRRPKPYALMLRKREELRADIRKNGHPKKLK
uniref:transposase n=1 Tax=Parendozoicomonas sp. Alg238-R29 TaxID=2993446 RepID=UPI00248D8E99